MKKSAFLMICTSALLAACGDHQNTASDAVADAPPAAIADARQVMLGLTIPASDTLFQIGENEPKLPADWDRIIANAAMLGESGNLLLTGSRDRHQPEWTRLAQELVVRSRAAMAAAQKQDVDAVLEAGNAIYEVCEDCHKKFMPAKLAEQ